MRPTVVGIVLAALLGEGGEVAAFAARQTVRCCVVIPMAEQPGRPWCFNVRARSRRAGHRACRAIGGRRPRVVP